MKEVIKVSVLVPIYNSMSYIERCVRSIFEQTYQDIEYIFFNDCSSDDSMLVLNSLLEEYPLIAPNVTIVNNPKRGG